MKKKMYEAPGVLVVRLTKCTMLAESGGGNSGSGPGGDEPGVRSWEFQDDSEW